MTAGSNQNGHDGSNHHAMRPRDDRETLSALFDGQLPGDAVRFALKRLDHDAQWRDTCGRWQLIGDVLRGESVAFAPAEFPASVMRALQKEDAVVISDPAVARYADAPTASSRRRWIGGAVAASVAMAAVLGVRPYLEQPRSQPASAAQATIASTSSALAAPESREPAPAAVATIPATQARNRSVATVANTVRAPAKRQTEDKRRVTPMPSPGSIESAPPLSGATAIAAAPVLPAVAPRPFMPPGEVIVTRPWPRASLPDATAAGALTVGFGGSAPSPSFYPFEPRLPASEAPPSSGQ